MRRASPAALAAAALLLIALAAPALAAVVSLNQSGSPNVTAGAVVGGVPEVGR